MNDELPDYTPLDPSTAIISNDGSLDLNGAPNLADNPDAVSQVDASDGGSIGYVAPLDNINQSSNVNDGNASPYLYSTINGGNAVEDILNGLTGGAQSLAQELPGFITPEPANTTQSSIAPTTLLLVGAGALLLILLVK